MLHFARRKTTGQERTLHFVPALAAAQRLQLPECQPTATPITTAKARDWRTVRLRPEVLAVVDGLIARSRNHLGEQLTISEVLAALILAGLPKVASQVPFRE